MAAGPQPQQPPTSVAPENVHDDISPLHVFVTASYDRPAFG